MKRKRILCFFTLMIICVPIFAEYTSYEGRGDDFIQIEKPTEDMPALLVITGNRGDHHFSVKSYNEQRSYLDLLVNTTEKYIGIIPIDLPNNTITKYLEISAEGDWEIHVFPIGVASRTSAESPVSNSGDYVLWVEGDPLTANISGNSGEHHFSVISYDIYGNYGGLLVNTTNRYSGKVMIPKDTLLLKISAEGDWSISFN